MTKSVTTKVFRHKDVGLNPQFVSGVLVLVGVHRQEWQLRLSAAVGLREHRQERPGSSSHPPSPLPCSCSLSLASLLSSLLSFSVSNRLLTPPPAPQHPFTEIPLALLFLFLPQLPQFSVETMTVTDLSCSASRWISETAESTGMEKFFFYTHSQRPTHSKSGLKLP